MTHTTENLILELKPPVRPAASLYLMFSNGVRLWRLLGPLRVKGSIRNQSFFSRL